MMISPTQGYKGISGAQQAVFPNQVHVLATKTPSFEGPAPFDAVAWLQ